ncbi:hypothetical protein COOONC_23688 [Cooperia oncophora]
MPQILLNSLQNIWIFCSTETPAISTIKSSASFIAQKNPLNDSCYTNPPNDSYYKKDNNHLKKFWANYEPRLPSHSSMKYLHVYLRNNMKFSGRPSVLTDNNGYKCYNDIDKAKALGDYFASLHETGLSDIYFRPYDIYRVLKHLKPSNTEPYDGFLLSFLRITCIPKAPGAQSLSEFRPISLTSTPIKAMEKIVREIRCCVSTATNLVDTLFDWNIAIHQRKSIDKPSNCLKTSNYKFMQMTSSYGMYNDDYSDDVFKILKTSFQYLNDWDC